MTDELKKMGSIEHEQRPSTWERSMLNNVLMASVKEQRSARRWKIFFRFFWTFLFLGYIGFLFFLNSDRTNMETQNHVAVVEVRGTIMAGEAASAQRINTALGEAFRNEHSQAVILQINSPGGSPVQAEMIYDEIKRLSAKYNKPVYAVIEDVGASAAYYIAAATDDIYVSRSSIVGSIGVLTNQFGFVGLMDKLGIERRLITSGGHKGIMDPFSPMTPTEEAFVRNMLNEIHVTFIDAVKAGRGDRLQISDEIFSGLFWIGQESIDRGLADSLGTVQSVARDVVGVERIVSYTKEPNMLELFARQIGAGIGDTAIEAIQDTPYELR